MQWASCEFDKQCRCVPESRSAARGRSGHTDRPAGQQGRRKPTHPDGKGTPEAVDSVTVVGVRRSKSKLKNACQTKVKQNFKIPKIQEVNEEEKVK